MSSGLGNIGWYSLGSIWRRLSGDRYSSRLEAEYVVEHAFLGYMLFGILYGFRHYLRWRRAKKSPYRIQQEE